MVRDYKVTDYQPETAYGGRGSGKKRGMNPMFVGIIIGLLLGISLALILAIWVNRANNPFVEKSRPIEALSTIAARQTAAGAPGQAPTPPTPSTITPKTSKPDTEKPRFEFYQILPGEKNERTSKPELAPPLAAPPRSADMPPKNVVEANPPPRADVRPEPRPVSGEILFLQAGAFQGATDAENMKAKIAFAGFEAVVRPVNFPDKGTLYRVRLGPFRSLEEVNRIKSSLSQSGIGVAVVKGAD